MKYIKTYEVALEIPNYKVGDYILTNRGISRILTVDSEPDLTALPYLIVLPDNEFYWIGEESVIREATPEEIQQYEIEKDTEKYNL